MINDLHNWRALLIEAPKPELRKFGFVMAAVILSVFGLVLPFLFKTPFPLWPRVLSLAFFVLAAFAPRTLRFFHGPWLILGALLGTINSFIILSLLFMIVFVPLGFVMRFLGKDPMNRTLHRTDLKMSYRLRAPDNSLIKNMEKPY